MNRLEHLLFILAEECAEVAQRASKAARFGMDEVEPGQSLNNAQRLMVEVNDLYAALKMLDDEGVIYPNPDFDAIDAKIAKVEKFLEYSRCCGTLPR